jgi:tetrahydromethanopterin:alpha-L-glutamate ligase
MIYIVSKPTDTAVDNSTAAVAKEIERAGVSYTYLDLDTINPFSHGLKNELIWVCGIKRDVYQFEMIACLSLTNRVINTPSAIAACASKVMTTALLKKYRINTPDTLYTNSRDRAGGFIRRHGKVVSKPVYGHGGIGVAIIDSIDELGTPPYYLQEYIPNESDYRVFVIDGRPVGAIRRVSDSVVHNVHLGGVGQPVEIDQRMHRIAVAAAEAVNTNYAGVDLLVSRGEYTVLEVNGTPNWHYMEAPIPRLLASYLMRRSQEMSYAPPAPRRTIPSATTRRLRPITVKERI